MSEHQHEDQLDAGAGDQLDVSAGDELDQPAGDPLADAPVIEAGDQDGDGETTGDQDTAPAFPDQATQPDVLPDDQEPAPGIVQPAVDGDTGRDGDQDATVTQPNPYSRGYGVTGKFDSDAAPEADDAGQVVQDDEAGDDDEDEDQ